MTSSSLDEVITALGYTREQVEALPDEDPALD